MIVGKPALLLDVIYTRSIDYQKGLRRLWIVGTAIWVVYAVVDHQIREWAAAFHYSLLRETGSLELAAARKQEQLTLIEACNTAERAACWTNEPDPRLSFFGWERRPGCERTQAFRDVLTHELRVRGIEPTTSGALGESCPDVMAKGVPIFNLVGFFSTILAPFVVLVVYWIVRWVVRGFARER